MEPVEITTEAFSAIKKSNVKMEYLAFGATWLLPLTILHHTRVRLAAPMNPSPHYLLEAADHLDNLHHLQTIRTLAENSPSSSTLAATDSYLGFLGDLDPLGWISKTTNQAKMELVHRREDMWWDSQTELDFLLHQGPSDRYSFDPRSHAEDLAPNHSTQDEELMTDSLWQHRSYPEMPHTQNADGPPPQNPIIETSQTKETGSEIQCHSSLSSLSSPVANVQCELASTSSQNAQTHQVSVNSKETQESWLNVETPVKVIPPANSDPAFLNEDLSQTEPRHSKYKKTNLDKQEGKKRKITNHRYKHTGLAIQESPVIVQAFDQSTNNVMNPLPTPHFAQDFPLLTKLFSRPSDKLPLDNVGLRNPRIDEVENRRITGLLQKMGLGELSKLRDLHEKILSYLAELKQDLWGKCRMSNCANKIKMEKRITKAIQKVEKRVITGVLGFISLSHTHMHQNFSPKPSYLMWDVFKGYISGWHNVEEKYFDDLERKEGEYGKDCDEGLRMLPKFDTPISYLMSYHKLSKLDLLVFAKRKGESSKRSRDEAKN
ncbi:hypothetical protein CROQUDRAFT_690456 [Cronartium quercuum f. sp. fusiforme G11]|uniref:Uncharacterized protein n=1 Tax=Cronartium quercuum f. sp. fusiforme G11 TaxID=708437 RepID=A0A9P6NAV0_9BASI|nr:hypothetical protein CROQUDRAFT_690456 [Cronartium quercuum f. sp. fusiforme G11]